MNLSCSELSILVLFPSSKRIGLIFCKSIEINFFFFVYVMDIKFLSMDNFQNLLKNYYQKYLGREPDEIGFSHYMRLLKKGEVNENTLRDIFLKSDEYKRRKQKEFYEKKYNLDEEFYGKVWIGQDDLWYQDMFTHTPLLHIDCMNFIKSKEKIKNVLEIGCGTGVYPINFKELFYQKDYTGIDISESAINHCKTHSNFNFQCGNYLQMNIDKKFDLVFSNAVIDHVYDIDLFLSKIISNCKKYAYISAYWGYYPNLEKHEMKYIKNEGYYLNKLSPSQIKKTLLANGLSENEFVIRSQKGGHKDIELETVIEIHRI